MRKFPLDDSHIPLMKQSLLPNAVLTLYRDFSWMLTTLLGSTRWCDTAARLAILPNYVQEVRKKVRNCSKSLLRWNLMGAFEVVFWRNECAEAVWSKHFLYKINLFSEWWMFSKLNAHIISVRQHSFRSPVTFMWGNPYHIFIF